MLEPIVHLRPFCPEVALKQSAPGHQPRSSDCVFPLHGGSTIHFKQQPKLPRFTSLPPHGKVHVKQRLARFNQNARRCICHVLLCQGIARAHSQVPSLAWDGLQMRHTRAPTKNIPDSSSFLGDLGARTTFAEVPFKHIAQELGQGHRP